MVVEKQGSGGRRIHLELITGSGKHMRGERRERGSRHGYGPGCPVLSSAAPVQPVRAAVKCLKK